MKSILVCTIAFSALFSLALSASSSSTGQSYQSDDQVRNSTVLAASVDTRNWIVNTIGDTCVSFGLHSNLSASGGFGLGNLDPTSLLGEIDMTYIVSSSPAGVLPFQVQWGLFKASGSRFGGNPDFSQTAVGTMLQIYGYIVYTDANGNGIYDQGEETSFNYFHKGNSGGFGLPGLSGSVSKTEGTVGSSQNYLITHQADGGNAKFRYLVSDRDSISQGVTNPADNAKLDVWFVPTYSRNDDPQNARIALAVSYTAYQTSASYKGNRGRGEGKGALSFSANGASAGLTWEPTAKASIAGQLKDVSVVSTNEDFDLSTGLKLKAGTSIDGQTGASASIGLNVQLKAKIPGASTLLIFSFDAKKPDELYWDPSTGTTPSSAVCRAASVAVVIASMILAFF